MLDLSVLHRGTSLAAAGCMVHLLARRAGRVLLGVFRRVFVEFQNTGPNLVAVQSGSYYLGSIPDSLVFSNCLIVLAQADL